MNRHIYALVLFLSLFYWQLGLTQSPYQYTVEELELSKIGDQLFEDLWDDKIKSVEGLNELISLSEKINSEFSRGLKQQLFSNWYRYRANTDKAQESVLKAENLLKNCCYFSKENARVKSNYCGILSNAALVNLDTILFNKAFSKISEAVKIAEVIKDTAILLDGLDYLGDVNYYSAYKKKNYDLALQYYKRVEEINVSYNSTYEAADNALGLANVNRVLNDPEQELHYFNKSEAISIKEDYFGVLYALYFDKAEIYENKGDYSSALNHKLKGYDYVLQSNDKEFINRADRQLWQTYKEVRNYEDALHHYERYQRSIAEMNKSEVLQLESELKYKEEILRKEKEITQLENQNLRSNRNLWLLITALTGGFLLLSLWINRRLKKNNKELETKNKEILMAQVMGQNIERKRMAGELHDNLNTKIAAIRWQLEAIQGTEKLQNPEMLENTINQLNDAYEDIRLISHNLMPETVQTIGLLKSIEDLIEKLNNSDKVKFHFITYELESVKFGSLAYPVYNIIFEMVNNIMKHAQAENAWISLSKDNQGDLQISVSDDGVGFEVDEKHGGYGIKNISSRVENLHGAYKIESAPGKGTKIYIEIPQL